MCPHTQIAELIRKYSKDLRINNFTRTGSNIQRGNLGFRDKESRDSVSRAGWRR